MRRQYGGVPPAGGVQSEDGIAIRQETVALSRISDAPCRDLLCRNGYGFLVEDEKDPRTRFMENPCAKGLSLVSKKEHTEEMVMAALEAESKKDQTHQFSPVLKFASKKVLTPEICEIACRQNHRNYEYVPMRMHTEELWAITKETKKRIEQQENKRIEQDRQETHDESIAVSENTVSPIAFDFSTDVLWPVALDMPSDDLMLASPKDNSLMVPILDFDDKTIAPVYYISDIHLEHQLDLREHMVSNTLQRQVHDKVSELVASIPERRGLILIGGDTAYGVRLARAFFKELHDALLGTGMDVVAILGNHELWDGNPETGSRDSISDVMRKYVQACGFTNYRPLLENALWMKYRGMSPVLLNGKAILEATDDELADLCRQSVRIVLGGVGFSGCNPTFNADNGIYRGTVSREEDMVRSARFRAVYEKVLRCAGGVPVIVLTHNPMHDWSDNVHYNPNWIYVNGHTHRNAIIRKDDGTTVLSDNQVGYESKPLQFKYFTTKGRYDPFAYLQDGIYQIAPEQYRAFNQARGVFMQYKDTSPVYMVKRAGAYMFFREQNGKLYILSGGHIKKAEHDIEYYFSNLPAYKAAVTAAFGPFNKALETISKEIKAFGGRGSIHGCIVDIDFCNHVYLDPMSGKLTPYYALDMYEKYVFDDIRALLEESVSQPYTMEWLHQEKVTMLDRYDAAMEKNLLPILSSHVSEDSTALATVPELVLDTGMYEPSRIMRSIQYIFDQDVVRVWNDAVIEGYVAGAIGTPTKALPC